MIGWLMVSAVIGVMFYIAWMAFDTQIKGLIRWVRYAEMWVISWFVGDDYPVQWGGSTLPFDRVLEAARTMPADQIDGTLLGLMSVAALEPLQWVFTVLLGLMALWAYMYGPQTHNRNKYDIQGLIKAQSKSFPVIAPFIRFDPSAQPPRPPGSPVPAELPLFAEALGPEEWLAYNTIPVPNGELDRGAAAAAFAKQLGPRWKGAKNLSPYKQILLAACCLKASRRRADADSMLGRLARCWSHDKGLQLELDKALIREARKVLRTRDLAAGTLKKCNQHAWQTTALMRGLLAAREEGGVLAPAQFVWLRGYDRSLWYPLNNLGRNSYHTEALGAMAHYKAEKLAMRPIPKPKVDFAVDSMVEYMAGSFVRPIPQLDYSKSQKRGIKKLKTAKA